MPTAEDTASGPRGDLFEDERIRWAIDVLGPVDGRRVLELGPLEGGHTTMLERAGADVVAVEAHRRAPRLALWTHYYDAAVNARRPDVAARFSGTTEVRHGDLSATGHVYEYGTGAGEATFCGGARPTAVWLTRPDLLAALRAVGFSQVEVQFDDPDHPHGPSISLVATR